MASVDEVLFARALTRCEAVTTQGDAWRADPRFHHVCRPPRAHLHVCVRGALLPDQHGRYAHAVQSAAFRGMALLISSPFPHSGHVCRFVTHARHCSAALTRELTFADGGGARYSAARFGEEWSDRGECGADISAAGGRAAARAERAAHSGVRRAARRPQWRPHSDHTSASCAAGGAVDAHHSRLWHTRCPFRQ